MLHVGLLCLQIVRGRRRGNGGASAAEKEGPRPSLGRDIATAVPIVVGRRTAAVERTAAGCSGATAVRLCRGHLAAASGTTAPAETPQVAYFGHRVGLKVLERESSPRAPSRV